MFKMTSRSRRKGWSYSLEEKDRNAPIVRESLERQLSKFEKVSKQGVEAQVKNPQAGMLDYLRTTQIKIDDKSLWNWSTLPDIDSHKPITQAMIRDWQIQMQQFEILPPVSEEALMFKQDMLDILEAIELSAGEGDVKKERIKDLIDIFSMIMNKLQRTIIILP